MGPRARGRSGQAETNKIRELFLCSEELFQLSASTDSHTRHSQKNRTEALTMMILLLALFLYSLPCLSLTVPRYDMAQPVTRPYRVDVSEPLKVFCDFQSLNGCYTQQRDPIVCQNVNEGKTTFLKIEPTDRFDVWLSNNGYFNHELIFFDIVKTFEMDPELMSLEPFSSDEERSKSSVRSLASLEETVMKTIRLSLSPSQRQQQQPYCYVRRDEAVGNVMTKLTLDGRRNLTTISTTSISFGCRTRF